MDPLCVLGVAANVVQLINFGGRLVSNFIEIYDAVDGPSSANRKLEKITVNLKSLCEELSRPSQNSEYKAIDAELALVPLSQSCQSLCNEILSSLQPLKANNLHGKRGSLRQASNCLLKEKAIRRYMDRLDNYRREIATHLVFIIR